MIAPEAASFTTLESRTVSFLWDGKTQPCVRLGISWAAQSLHCPAQMEPPTPLKEINRLGTSAGQPPMGTSPPPPTGEESMG